LLYFSVKVCTMGQILLYPKKGYTTKPQMRGTIMPPPQAISETPFALLVVKWMKAQKGLLTIAHFAKITDIGYSVVRNWMYNGVLPEVGTLVKIATRTRQYNLETNIPDYDPDYPFDEPGIPLEELTKACNVQLETAKDFWIAVTTRVRQETMNEDERQERLRWLEEMWQWYKDGKPPIRNIKAS